MKPSQIQLAIRSFRDSLPKIFPNKTDVAKTIIFANDSNANAIIKAALKEFGESSDFCKKVTTKDSKTKSAFADFCYSFNPRIIVIVE